MAAATIENVLSGPRPRGPAEVVARLQAIVAALPASDGVAAFSALYLDVTEAVVKVMREQSVEDERFLRALDVAFADLYFDALRGLTGAGPAPRAWAPLIEARGRHGVIPLQFALAGMNAHINRDLPVALVDTATKLGVELKSSSPQHRDFRRIDAVLATTEELAKRRFLTGPYAEVDAALGHVDDVLAMWKVAEAREAAWTNGELLWSLRGAPHLRSEFLRTLDRMVGFAGRGLLRPLGARG